MKQLTRMAAAAAFALVAATPAQAQYTYGAPDYDFDRGWYGTNNWYNTNNHFNYLYNTPPRRYSIPGYGGLNNPYSLLSNFDDYNDRGLFGAGRDDSWFY